MGNVIEFNLVDSDNSHRYGFGNYKQMSSEEFAGILKQALGLDIEVKYGAVNVDGVAMSVCYNKSTYNNYPKFIQLQTGSYGNQRIFRVSYKDGGFDGDQLKEKFDQLAKAAAERSAARERASEHAAKKAKYTKEVEEEFEEKFNKSMWYAGSVADIDSFRTCFTLNKEEFFKVMETVQAMRTEKEKV